MPKNVRVRFAPSPTGGLHLGGVRTVLYNYLFAHQHGGTFILRIEDTDQSRFVPGAEEYIHQCLAWCGLEPDESPQKGGPYGPYRQSERKELYRQYAEQLVAQGHAYYAFDTPAELDEMRLTYKTDENPSPQYNQLLRAKMRNSLTLDSAEVNTLLAKQTAHVIRIKMPENEDVFFTDMIRGTVHFNSSQTDDKVLLKADGMPTYHLAVVVDDYLMKISHAFRGEEWLPSAPVHILLWKCLGWEEHMPEWAHFPLIMKPDGKGKLSKRDGDRLGFPVFAMDWRDPASGEITNGFREIGFLPEAFINMLAVLGWNDGSEQEIFSMDELIASFSFDRVHKAGARFDIQKANWFNQQYLKQLDDTAITGQLKPLYADKGIEVNDDQLAQIVHLLKDRVHFVKEIVSESLFLFSAPEEYDQDVVIKKWNEEAVNAIGAFKDALAGFEGNFVAHDIKEVLSATMEAAGIKMGKIMQALRLAVTGAGAGCSGWLRGAA